MKKKIIVTFVIDTDDYDEPLNTTQELLQLGNSILNGDADMPNNLTISLGEDE